MNIFVLDLDPWKCAEYHCDKHVVKMILESVQMLSTACRLSGHQNVGYKKTHIKHPCTLWTCNTIDNWLWLEELTIALNDQYKKRYAKKVNHKSYDVMMTLPNPLNSKKGLTTFAQAMPDIYKDVDVVKAYKNYYIHEKSSFAVWEKLDNTPQWWIFDQKAAS